MQFSFLLLSNINQHTSHFRLQKTAIIRLGYATFDNDLVI